MNMRYLYLLGSHYITPWITELNPGLFKDSKPHSYVTQHCEVILLINIKGCRKSGRSLIEAPLTEFAQNDEGKQRKSSVRIYHRLSLIDKRNSEVFNPYPANVKNMVSS